MARFSCLRYLLVPLLLLLALAAGAQPPPLFYAVLSDTQKGDNDPFADFRWAVEQVNALRPQFVLFPGDLTNEGTISQYEHWLAVRRDLQVPLYACPGNHEGSPGPQEYSRQFSRFLGRPTYYRQLLPGWTLIALDGVCFKETKLQHEGCVSAEQRAWLRAQLAAMPPPRPVLVMCHFPLLPAWRQLANASEVLDCFCDHYLVYTIAGHLHANTQGWDDHGRLHLVTSSLSFAGPPDGIGYRLLSTVGLDLYTAWVRRDVQEPLTLLAEKVGAEALTVPPPVGEQSLAVRVAYDGGPLRLRLTGPSGGEWAGILPFAPVSTQALIPLQGPRRTRLSGSGPLRLSVEPLTSAQVQHLALYSTSLTWEHCRLPAAPSSAR